MIGALKGIVAHLATDNCILDTAGGVGYRVFMPAAHLAQLSLGKEVRVHVHTAVREDAILLYGFLSQEYYDLFELLLTVSGVGPKMALGILSAIKPDAFYLAVQSKDMKVLVKLPGVGKKTAERLIVELRDKLDNFDTVAVGVKSDGSKLDKGESQAIEDVVTALTQLGYKKDQAVTAVQKIVAEFEGEIKAEELLRFALQRIGR